MNFINFWFFKQLFYSIRKLTKHKILLLIIFAIIIYFLIQSKCFAVQFNYGTSSYNMTVETPPTSIYNNLVNNTSFNSELHDFIIYRMNPYTTTGSNDTAYYAVYFLKSSSTKIWLDANPSGSYFRFKSSGMNNPIAIFKYNNDGTRLSGTGSNFYANSQIVSYIKSRSGNNFTYEFLSSLPMYNGSTSDEVIIIPYHPTYAPFIVNDQQISDLSFTNLLINSGGMIIPSNGYDFIINYSYNNNNYAFNINQYLLIDENTNPRTYYFNIPKYEILKNLIIIPNTSITFTLTCTPDFDYQNTWDLGTYALSITQEEADIINSTTNQTTINNNTIINQQTADNTQQINESINNSDIEFNTSNLPSDNTEDITQDGINGIFTSIYNAFCSGTAQDIVFPIPFTGRDISLSANYVRQMLSSSNANWVITIIEAFWWYLISRYIVSDISKKITKIKSGNIENIQNDNIKEEML